MKQTWWTRLVNWWGLKRFQAQMRRESQEVTNTDRAAQLRFVLNHLNAAHGAICGDYDESLYEILEAIDNAIVATMRGRDQK